MSTELEEKPTAVTVVERAALALGASEHEKALIALSKKYADIVSIENKAGRDQVHSAAMELGNARIATKKNGEAAREDANAFRTAVIAEVNRRIAIVSAEETRLLALRDKWDAEREAEKIAKALAESQRITAIRTKIDEFRNAPQRWINKPSDDIGAAADHLSQRAVSLAEYAEYTGECQSERDNAVKQLRTMQEAMRAHEFQQAALEAERETLSRERAAAEERERVAAAARAEYDRRVAAERAEQEAKDRAERQAEADRLSAERKAWEAEMRRQREAEEAQIAAGRAELALRQAEIDRAQAEQERVAREAREAAEAVQKLEADHAEALEENARIDAENAARAESVRIRAEQDAAIAEQIRREQEQFSINGPGDVAIVKLLAYQYDVTVGDVMQWMKKFDYAAADEQLAAENVAAN